ncbi:hypothetical protein J7L01_00790 [bacterium]|nr:hypothetical protein [bacterium]
MISWAFFIIVLDLILVFQLLQCDCLLTAPTIAIVIGIGLGGLAIIIRTLVKIKQGTREKLGQELQKLRDENKELLERIADFREKEIIERADGENLI